jgi:beta-glucosidase
MAPGGIVRVSTTVTNPGPATVTETLQLYLRNPVASISRPIKELRGYQRITLAPGESRTFEFTLTDSDLAFPGPDYQPLVEPGKFIVMLGSSSVTTTEASFLRL